MANIKTKIGSKSPTPSPVWIAGANIKKGALHRALGIPIGQKIPRARLAEARQSKDPHIRKMAVLARTLEGFNK